MHITDAHLYSNWWIPCLTYKVEIQMPIRSVAKRNEKGFHKTGYENLLLSIKIWSKEKSHLQRSHSSQIEAAQENTEKAGSWQFLI